MHPSIRIVSLIVLALALPALRLADLTILGLLLLLLLARGAAPALQSLRMGIWRLRWLLLSLAVLYGGFTPGEPWLRELPGLSREGLAEGTRRILVLLDLLIAVQLLLTLTAREQLVMGIAWLATPMSVLGLDRLRVARRLGAALDGVGAAEAQIRAGRDTANRSLASLAAGALLAIEHAAATDTAPEPALPPMQAPRAWQWAWPLGLGLLLHGLAA